MEPNIRIMVAEHNAILRDGIVALIEGQPDMQVVSTASDAIHAFLEFQRTQPQVTIVDVDILDGIELMKRLRRELRGTKIIALVNYEWDDIAQTAAQVSGSACLPKDNINRRLLALIREEDYV